LKDKVILLYPGKDFV